MRSRQSSLLIARISMQKISEFNANYT